MLKSKKSKIITATVIVAVLLVAGAVLWGIFAPAGTVAATYGNGRYIYEKDVTSYIQTYQSQVGMLNASQDEWAEYLQENDLTPETLRERTIHQLLYDAIIRDKCEQLGLNATSDEIDAATKAFRESMSFGNDELWNQTLEMYGQTEEGFDSVYELAILKEKLIDQEVEKQQPTDDDVREYIDALSSQGVTSTKHSFAFKMAIPSNDDDASILNQVNEIRSQFMAGDRSKESFAAFVQIFSDNDALKESQGANGWDLDQSEYSEEYVSKLDALEKGDVSDVFKDGDDYCFIFVSDVYDFPKVEMSKIDLGAVPDSLLSYFKDGASKLLTDDAGEAYIEKLIEDSHPSYNPMPEDVPYNVAKN